MNTKKDEPREIYRVEKNSLGRGHHYSKARVVTSNDFITSEGLEKLTLKSRKLLYLAIAQCRMEDTEFYTYRITAQEFADLMDVSVNDVYQTIDKITSELMSAYINVKIDAKRGKKDRFRRIPLFALCEYSEGILKFELNPRMADLLLDLQRDFSKPLLTDFLPMRSTYSIAIWHLMQEKMHSQFPGVRGVFEFDLSLNELRQVTGTQNKFTQVGGTSGFKAKILDKAIREIEECAWVVVTYTDIKENRRIIGFHCSAVSTFHVDEDTIPQAVKDRAIRKREEMTRRQKHKREIEESSIFYD